MTMPAKLAIAPPLSSPGLWIDVRVTEIHDADTYTLRLVDTSTAEVGLIQFALRPLDCEAPEVRGEEKAEGERWKNFVMQLLEDDPPLRAFIPFTSWKRFVQDVTTLGRVKGFLYLEGQSVGRLVMEHFGYRPGERRRKRRAA